MRIKTDSQVFTDYTVWTSATDTQNGAYYFKTYKNQAIQKVDLEQILKEANGKASVIDSETPRGCQLVGIK